MSCTNSRGGTVTEAQNVTLNGEPIGKLDVYIYVSCCLAFMHLPFSFLYTGTRLPLTIRRDDLNIGSNTIQVTIVEDSLRITSTFTVTISSQTSMFLLEVIIEA